MMCCPNCGSGRAVSNLADERPFVAAAQEAERLRHFGEATTARDVLMRLAMVRTENFLVHDWRCEDCGVNFDG